MERRWATLFVGLDHRGLDISDVNAVDNAIDNQNFELVINAAAYTAVDKAETDTATAYRVNKDGPAILAAACSRANIPLIHISTDYVFDGTFPRPYDEKQPVFHLGVYGKSKEAGEQNVRSLLTKHIILRTSWVYGRHGNNFVKIMLRLGGERDEIGVVADQFGCPTNAGDLADAILIIASHIKREGRGKWGTYHCCGNGDAGWYDFAMEIFKIAGEHTPLRLKKVHFLTTSDYPTPAQRPANSRLDCTLLQDVFGVTMSHWRDSLASMLEEFLVP